jgi:predicted  nucleic acid-binding Zn-ribbon protein
MEKKGKSTMFCPECGKELSEAEVLCPQCGASVLPTDAAQEAEPVQDNVEEMQISFSETDMIEEEPAAQEAEEAAETEEPEAAEEAEDEQDFLNPGRAWEVETDMEDQVYTIRIKARGSEKEGYHWENFNGDRGDATVIELLTQSTEEKGLAYAGSFRVETDQKTRFEDYIRLVYTNGISVDEYMDFNVLIEVGELLFLLSGVHEGFNFLLDVGLVVAGFAHVLFMLCGGASFGEDVAEGEACFLHDGHEVFAAICEVGFAFF